MKKAMTIDGYKKMNCIERMATNFVLCRCIANYGDRIEVKYIEETGYSSAAAILEVTPKGKRKISYTTDFYIDTIKSELIYGRDRYGCDAWDEEAVKAMNGIA